MGARPQHDLAYRRLCKLLKKWRTDAGLTQVQMAERLNWRNHSYVAKAESGVRRIDPIEMVRWYRICGIKAAEAIEALETLIDR